MNYKSSVEYERLIRLGVDHEYALVLACQVGGQTELAEEVLNEMKKEQNKMKHEMEERQFTPFHDVIMLASDPSMNICEAKDEIPSLMDPNRYDPLLVGNDFDPSVLLPPSAVISSSESQHDG